MSPEQEKEFDNYWTPRDEADGPIAVLFNKVGKETKAFISHLLQEERERIREGVQLEVAGLLGIIESNIQDSGQVHIAEMRLEKVLSLLTTKP